MKIVVWGGGYDLDNNRKEPRRRIKTIFLGIIAALLILVGTSYAWWTTTATQTEVNVVQSSCLKLAITNEKNNINLPEAYPIPDQEGKKLEPYTFTITNNCDTPIDYTVALEMLNESNLSSNYVKYELKEQSDTSIIYLNILGEEPEETTRVLENTQEGRILLEDTIEKSKPKNFSLKLWMDNDTPAIEDAMDKIFKSKIVVKGEVAAPGMLRTPSYLDNQGMWQYRSQITQIVIEDHIYKPEGTEVLGPNDESRYQDKSVVSYLVPNEDETYTAHLQGNGGITLNYNSSNLFYKFNKVTSIEGIENLNTNKVRNMGGMFYGVSLTQLDLGDNFDTSQVTNMNSMFIYSGLIKLSLGDKFDTSQVTNMASMFAIVGRLTQLDLGDKFDTSNVTDMGNMFYCTGSLTELNLGDKFDTSNVTNMGGLFSYMGHLTHIEYGKKFVHNPNANIEGMFSSCSANKPDVNTHPSWAGVTFDE